MARKRVTKRRSSGAAPPSTVGDLRGLLSARGNPWQPDPRLSDEEPLPVFPTGGDTSTDPVGVMLPKGRAIDAIKKDLPSNPHLRDLWMERGIVKRTERTRKAVSRKSQQSTGNG
jgi:hypothetical protein